MPAPSLPSFSGRLYEQLQPLQFEEEQNAYALAHLCAALGQSFQEIDDYVYDTDLGEPGWSLLLDVERCPLRALPWLGQMVGVTLDTTLSEADQRAQVSAAEGFRRGTTGSIIASAQLWLTGDKQVILRERNGGAYKLTIKTRRDETPPEDWESTNILINGGFESNTTGWSAVNGTIVRVVAPGKFGNAYGLLTNTAGTVTSALHDSAISGATAGRIFTASIYIRGTGVAIGTLATILLEERGGASGAAADAAAIVLTNDWQRMTVTRTIVQNDRTSLRLYAESNISGAVTHLDGAQVEEKSAATPYIETNGAPASRLTGFGPVGSILKAQKPGGIILTYEVIDGQDWQNVIDTQASWTSTMAAYGTIDLLEEG